MSDDRLSTASAVRGFTLIELMVVLLIIAIIVAIAFPGYTRQVQDTRRAAMQGDMTAFATTLETYRAQRFSYTGADALLATPSNDFFNVALTITPDGRSYELLATPLGMMAGSGAMKLDNQGRSCHLETDDADCDVTDPTQAWGHK